MDGFSGKVAVVTGAGSGIGRALSLAFAKEKMHLVIVDRSANPLKETENMLTSMGTSVLACIADVQNEEEVKLVADQAFSKFGNVHILCNNAGISALPVRSDNAWDAPNHLWQLLFSVNVMSVIYGIRHFVPRMISKGEWGHIVNTASMAGMIPTFEPYSLSKNAVVAITEGLWFDFKNRKCPLSCSMLMPGLVNTNILSTSSSFLSQIPKAEELTVSQKAAQFHEFAKGRLAAGLDPGFVADAVLTAVKSNQLYIMPSQEEFLEKLRKRMHCILENRNPDY